MRAFIHNVAPSRPTYQFVTAAGGGEVSDAAWAALEQRVDTLKKTAEELMAPGRIEAMVTEAMRPFATKIAQRENELRQQNGLRTHGKFRPPSGDGENQFMGNARPSNPRAVAHAKTAKFVPPPAEGAKPLPSKYGFQLPKGE